VAGGPISRPDPDVGLVAQAREGDSGAFDQLVRKHQAAMYGLIMRMVGETAVAEELTQDTFLRAWRNLGGFREASLFSTWLYRIAVNLCRDHLGSWEKRRRQVEVGLDGPDQKPLPLVSPGPGPDARLEEREMAATFQNALEALDPVHRAAFLLRHQEGLTPAEIAGALGISVANAKVRVHRARAMIMEAMRKAGEL
jgi:RNA polymerase sigma-70 factor, ECF subfamily